MTTLDEHTRREYESNIANRIFDGKLSAAGTVFFGITSLIAGITALTSLSKMHGYGTEAGNAGVTAYTGFVCTIITAVACYSQYRTARSDYKKAADMERILFENAPLKNAQQLS